MSVDQHKNRSVLIAGALALSMALIGAPLASFAENPQGAPGAEAAPDAAPQLAPDPAPAVVVDPVMTSGGIPDGTVGVAYSYQFTADEPVTWSSANLPAWLSLDSVSGVLAGTPDAAGTSTFFVTGTAADGGSVGVGVHLPVNDVIVVTQGPSIDLAPIPDVSVGQPFSYQLVADQPVTWTITGLPDGLELNTSTGEVTGSPTADGSFPLVVTATGADGQSSQTGVTLVVAPVVVSAGPTITTTELPDATVGAPYSFQIATSGPFIKIELSILPDGLAVSSTGEITGTPTTAGTSSVTIKLLDSTLTVIDQKTLPFTIQPQIAPPTPPVVTSGDPTEATVGEPYSFQLTSSKPGVTYAVTGLPDGLHVDSATGLISGTPATPANTHITVVLDAGTDGGLSNETVFLFTVKPQSSMPTPTPTPTPTTTPDPSTPTPTPATTAPATPAPSTTAETGGSATGASSGSTSTGTHSYAPRSSNSSLAETGRSQTAVTSVAAVALVLLVSGVAVWIVRRVRRRVSR